MTASVAPKAETSANQRIHEWATRTASYIRSLSLLSTLPRLFEACFGLVVGACGALERLARERHRVAGSLDGRLRIGDQVLPSLLSHFALLLSRRGLSTVAFRASVDKRRSRRLHAGERFEAGGLQDAGQAPRRFRRFGGERKGFEC